MMLSESPAESPRPSARSRLVPGLSLRAGDLLAGRYRITSLLRANRACAYLAASLAATGTPVEVQVLLAMDDGLDPVRLRFLAEARRAATLDGPHVLKILDVGITKDGLPFVASEAPPGEPLAKLLERLGSLPTEGAVDVALAVCEALAAAHAQGIVHSELSPAVVNVAWSADGPHDVKVLDLGISRALAMLPLDARVIESLGIRAPELLQSNAEPEDRADIWGVGILLYTMLAGAPPFASESPSTVNVSVALDEPAMLAGVPDDLGDLVDACLARDPALRPATMRALASKLAPFGSRAAFAKPASPRGGEADPSPAATSIEAVSEREPEPAVVAPSIAPVSFGVAPAAAAGARAVDHEPKRRPSRSAVIAAAACVSVGVLIGVGSTRLASAPPSVGVQAAPPPRADAPRPIIDAPPLPLSVAVDSASVLPSSPAPIAVADLRSIPTALPPARPGSLPAKSTAPESAPLDPLVRSAAAPIHPEPKVSDDDLRRFLDDRR